MVTVGELVYFIGSRRDETMKRYLGVDLHRNCFTVCTLREDGKSELKKWSIHSLKKTDAHDAKTLAEFLAKDMLPEVRMKEDMPAEIASLLQTRDKLVKLRTTLKNKINNLLSARGFLLPKESLSTEKGLEQVLQKQVGELARVELKQTRHLNTYLPDD
jgi:transposase